MLDCRAICFNPVFVGEPEDRADSDLDELFASALDKQRVEALLQSEAFPSTAPRTMSAVAHASASMQLEATTARSIGSSLMCWLCVAS